MNQGSTSQQTFSASESVNRLKLQSFLTPLSFTDACQLTLDSNTANKMLRISEDRRNVAKTREVQRYADHPDRFSLANVQVLCRESLSDRCYWELEFGSKKTKIAVTYRGIPAQVG